MNNFRLNWSSRTKLPLNRGHWGVLDVQKGSWECNLRVWALYWRKEEEWTQLTKLMRLVNQHWVNRCGLENGDGEIDFRSCYGEIIGHLIPDQTSPAQWNAMLNSRKEKCMWSLSVEWNISIITCCDHHYPWNQFGKGGIDLSWCHFGTILKVVVC